MSNPSQSLFTAILDDDRARAQGLLKKNPHLSRQAVETDGRYEAGIAHWISGSTPFHLAVQNTGRGGTGAEKAKTAQREIIQTFLERGVSVALKDRNGESILHWAKSDSIRQILLSNAA